MALAAPDVVLPPVLSPGSLLVDLGKSDGGETVPSSFGALPPEAQARAVLRTTTIEILFTIPNLPSSALPEAPNSVVG